MNSKERFYAAMEYKGYDRPPTIYRGTLEVNGDLMEHMGFSSYEELLLAMGDDFRYINPEYRGPKLKVFEDGSWEGLWGEVYVNYSFGSGRYPEVVSYPFKNVTDVKELDHFRFPSPDWYDYSGIKKRCLEYKDYAVITGAPIVPDFINGIGRCRTFEQVYLDIATEDPVFLELMERRFRFFYEMYERALTAGEGLIDILCLGEDVGSQKGLSINPLTFERLFAPKLEAFIKLAHKHGARAMLHSCGSCRDLIPAFIEMGVDILDVVQVDAAKMDISELHKEYYGKIAFCGSISVQSLLPFGNTRDIRREVELRKRLFPKGGLIIAPAMEIQVGTPIVNIMELYRSIGSTFKVYKRAE